MKEARDIAPLVGYQEQTMASPPNDKVERRRRTTVADIARSLGVSIATVSYVLSGRQGVNISQATRDRVLEAARQLGYKRNGLAAALRTGRLNTIAVVCPAEMGRALEMQDLTYISSSILALVLAAGKLQLNAVMFLDQQARDIDPEDLADGRVDGAVFLSTAKHSDYVQAVLATGLPCVEIGSSQGRYQVHMDNREGATAAVRHLTELGHRRLVHLCGPPGVVSSGERREAFYDAAASCGLSPEQVAETDDVAGLRRIFSEPEQPTAIFAYNDRLAVEAASCLRTQGLRIPEDVSLVGFDDDLRSKVMQPPLTTVLNPLDDMAEVALRMLLSQINGELIPEEKVVVATKFIVRESTAPPKG
jgi:LacI family transcriptional regulator